VPRLGLRAAQPLPTFTGSRGIYQMVTRSLGSSQSASPSVTPNVS
jgi:hypothetical protein